MSAPNDVVGAETLGTMAGAWRYSRWQYDVIAPYLGSRILEVGSGIGNVARHIVSVRRDLVVLTDSDPLYREQLTRQFGGHAEVRVHELRLPDNGGELQRYQFDTAVALNVLEHIENDSASLRVIADLVTHGSSIVVLVPALPSLHGSLDVALGHYRRYTPASLERMFSSAGVRLQRTFWFNRAGVLGWWLNSRVLGNSILPGRQVALFDRMVPALRQERFLPLPFGLSLVGIGERD